MYVVNIQVTASPTWCQHSGKESRRIQHTEFNEFWREHFAQHCSWRQNERGQCPGRYDIGVEELWGKHFRPDCVRRQHVSREGGWRLGIQNINPGLFFLTKTLNAAAVGLRMAGMNATGLRTFS